MSIENTGARDMDAIEEEASSTRIIELDTPIDLPKFIGTNNNSRLACLQRSKSVPNSSHTDNRGMSTNIRSGHSFSVQWRSSRYAKILPASSSSSGASQRPTLTIVNRELQVDEQLENVETPPPHYSSLDPSLDIVPGYQSRVNHACSASGSDSVMNMDPPPSYRELFSNRMRHTVRQVSVHSVTSEFSQACSYRRMTKVFVIGILLLCFAILLPVAMVIQGISHLDDCPIEPRIPILLIIAGLLQILECSGRFVCKNCKPDQESRDMSWDPLLYIFIITLIISGIYIYQTHPSFDPEGSVTNDFSGNIQTTMQLPTTSGSSLNLYCDETTFKLAFWTVTCYLVMICFSMIGIVALALLNAYLTYRERRRLGLHDRDEEQA